MAAILLTHANLHHLKSRLRTALPHVKSSYISEGLAAALGYRTHAALLAGMKASREKYPPLARVSDVKLTERLSDFGADDQAVDLSGMAREALPDPIWRAFAKRERAANDNWFYACQRRNVPFVYLHIGRKYWRLNWDCISTEKNYDAHLRGDAGTTLMRAMFKRFQERTRLDPTQAMFDGSTFVGTVDGLLPQTACDLADDFFEMLYTPVRAA
ncbi:hypothetical protein [Novosphingobium mathurense]|uniref:Uncharacterized protein n=1 Tax=Novosphingobium mathurense TaxID=428990 RepID=A0A1U6GR38_9SPHN|nr:hypothetical protein [Novosphingobium mathurense]SLJ85997.1 hypothetical protein SAMN06295987_1014 [Novosphingobium mathurense]HKY82812.1 hypothetical protein [Sphingobium sp.]